MMSSRMSALNTSGVNPERGLEIIVLWVFLLAFNWGTLYAQNYPQDFFKSPLRIPLLLSGNYGELRSNHFHSGIDIKTQGVEGKEVLAAADGYVSRIKIQEGGYGKTLYITHPNGFTTVYAHLQRYAFPIDSIVKAKQYEEERYTVEWYPDAGAITVKQGQIIAYSGNTGGSGGPHLHFEIRETDSEIPVNPLLFGFDIKDNIPPVVKGIVIYPMDNRSMVDGGTAAKYFNVVKKGSHYTLPPIRVAGRVGIGIETDDYLNSSNNRCGVYDFDLKVNDETIYRFKTDRIPFDQSRYINAHCDYAFKKKTGKWIHLVYALPNNGLEMYSSVVNSGIINTLPDSTYRIHLDLKEAYGNSASFSTEITAERFDFLPIAAVSAKFQKVFSFDEENSYQTDSFKLYLPKGALYDDLDFEYQFIPNDQFLSDIHSVHEFYTPLHLAATYSIRCRKMPADPEKVVVLVQHKHGKSYIKGSYINGWVNFNFRGFANFIIDSDQQAPRIVPVNFKAGQNISSLGALRVKISDDKAGISHYRATVNGKWILMEYDYKKALLTHVFDGKFNRGENHLRIELKDEVGNLKVYETTLLFD